jgi:hypothetical protein
MRRNALRLNLCSGRADDDGGCRNSENWPPELKKKRRNRQRLGASELNSLHGDEEDDEADLLVPSVRRGVVCSGGAMVGGGGTVGFLPLVCLQRKKRKVSWRRLGRGEKRGAVQAKIKRGACEGDGGGKDHDRREGGSRFSRDCRRRRRKRRLGLLKSMGYGGLGRRMRDGLVVTWATG